jgi:hypothetical protein
LGIACDLDARRGAEVLIYCRRKSIQFPYPDRIRRKRQRLSSDGPIKIARGQSRRTNSAYPVGAALIGSYRFFSGTKSLAVNVVIDFVDHFGATGFGNSVFCVGNTHNPSGQNSRFEAVCERTNVWILPGTCRVPFRPG